VRLVSVLLSRLWLRSMTLAGLVRIRTVWPRAGGQAPSHPSARPRFSTAAAAARPGQLAQHSHAADTRLRVGLDSAGASCCRHWRALVSLFACRCVTGVALVVSVLVVSVLMVLFFVVVVVFTCSLHCSNGEPAFCVAGTSSSTFGAARSSIQTPLDDGGPLNSAISRLIGSLALRSVRLVNLAASLPLPSIELE
jgi:hypothetical protein